MTGLTRKQAELLEWLRRHCDSHQHSPSFREMAAATGVASISNIHRMVNTLVERGYVEYEPDRARTIRLVERETLRLPSAWMDYIRTIARTKHKTAAQVVMDAVMAKHPLVLVTKRRAA